MNALPIRARRARALLAALAAAAAAPALAAPPGPAAAALREEQESTDGYATELSLDAAVARFNARARAVGGEPSGRTQPPLTAEEVRAALWGRLLDARPLPPDLAAAYRRIVEAGVLPAGALLDVARGFSGARPGGDCAAAPMDVALWEIRLHVGLDRPPAAASDAPRAEPLVVRLQHVAAAPAKRKVACEPPRAPRK